MPEAFLEISIIMAVALGVATIMHLLRQPLIIGHIITGLLVGPYVLNLLHSPETLEVFSSIGITLLLFVVGLGLNPGVIREVGKTAVITGVGQVLFTTIVGFFLAQWLGFGATEAAFIGLAISFSSTIIIMKLLTDKREINQLYGKISVGFLLIQDLIATFALVFVVAMAEKQPLVQVVPLLFVKLVAALAVVILVARYALPKLSRFVASSGEFLFLFALAWGLGVATVFKLIGLSIEVGALVAGVALASAPYSLEVSSRMKPLRDFFIVVFFILLGAGMKLTNVGDIILPAVLFSVLILIGNPIIVMTLMRFLGYAKKTNFKAGLAVAQISEFSLIFIVLSQKVGLVSEEISSMMTLIGIITIAVSTYMIIYADQLYELLQKPLEIFEKKSLRQPRQQHEHYDVIVFGYERAGFTFIEKLQKMKTKFLVVDYNPDIISDLTDKGIPARFGDANDLELLQELDLDHTKMVISVLANLDANRLILDQIPVRSKIIRVVTSDAIDGAEQLYDAGATYVMMPHYISGVHTSKMLNRDGFELSVFLQQQQKHKSYILRTKNKA